MLNNLIFTAAVLFQSVLGDVTDKEVFDSLKRMGFGMLGILIVMVLIWIVIAVLNRVFSGKNEEK